MHLTLRSHETAQRPARAAFLRGANPAAWLRELGRWNLPADQLACYLVPESIRSVRVAGLFVIAQGPLPAEVLEPYGSEADGRLYVPVHATLWPATAPHELATALLWPQQLLHPSIGLVGFDTTDELDLATLLDCGTPQPTDWTRARPGRPPKPRLQQVRVLPPTGAEVVQGMREDVGTVPLTELPGQAEARPGPIQRVLDGLRRGLLKLSLALVRGLPNWPAGRSVRLFGFILVMAAVSFFALALISQLSKGSVAPLVVPLLLLGVRLWRSFLGTSDGSPRRPIRAQRLGLFQRLEGWLGGRIKDLEQKRQGEIERLLRLFGEDMDEALKYAIPLGGPYQDRGTAPESARLGPRATEFNLGGLGGGGRVDAWNLDAYRHNLSLQYRAAATREIDAGRPKKAAYIYAHLLGDYQAAASTLDQGGFTREAAALYQDHLHNRPAAAKCLEHGGLLLEAAELYAELNEHEKAGDLHQRLDQPALAARHYERGAALLLANDDHPAAARLLAEKLTAPQRAQDVLLAGWDDSKQPEVCLRQYFDVVAAQPNADLSAHVRAIFQGRTPRERRGPLLQVLATVSEKHPTPALLATSREVAYDVVSTEAAAGNMAHLPLLRHFLPGDRLIAADCSRFATSPARPTKPVVTPSSTGAVPPLEASIEWKSAVTHRHQWVAIGLRDERLHLARGNWYGHVEYYSWMTPVEATTAIGLLADDRHSARILLRPSAALALETKQLPKNKYFPEALTVECPSWLPPWPTRVALLPDGTAVAAHLRGTAVTMERYTAKSKQLTRSMHYFSNVTPDFSLTERPWPCELLYHEGRYYSYWANWLLSWSEDGRSTDCERVDGEIYQLVRSPYAPELQVAVGTQEGVVLWTPTAQGLHAPGPVIPIQGEAPNELKFVGAEYLVTLGDAGAELHFVGEDGYELVRVIKTERRPVAVLATLNRRQFALLESTGRMTLHLVTD